MISLHVWVKARTSHTRSWTVGGYYTTACSGSGADAVLGLVRRRSRSVGRTYTGYAYRAFSRGRNRPLTQSLSYSREGTR